MDQVTGQAQTSVSPRLTVEEVFPGVGEMAALMRATDWTRTPLGSIAEWPQSLRTALSICLASRFPILIWWGPELVMLYNDAYRDIIAAKHPQALGAPGREVFPEIWDVIGPMLAGVLREGKATWSDDQFLPLLRHGYAEECYFTFSYSPIYGEDGGVGGVFTAVAETTHRVLSERRTRLARDLSAAIMDAHSGEQVCARAAEVLARDAADVPFALLYLLDRSGEQARLAASAGLDALHPLAPAAVPLGAAASGEDTISMEEAAEEAPWPLAQVARSGQRAVVTELARRWQGPPVRAGSELTPHTALVLPINEPGQAVPSAVLVAGVSPRRALDDNYEGFYELLVGHLSASLASAHAYEAERKRAEALAEIDRAKTAFFSNVSHEFRTPLTLMLGPLHDLLAGQYGGLAPDARMQLDLAHRNGLRMLKLVNTLLDFARIEAGRVQAIYEPTDLAAYTAELASSFRSLVEKAGMELIVSCPPLVDLAEPVYVDRGMWEKIVLNLVSNAFKFTLEGAIAVTLRPINAGRAVELEVRDTGVGIPAAELPRLFERFHRIEGSQARTHEGSGIGLALVQELVHLHGGTIQVESAEQVGTRVVVELPTGADHLPAEHVRTRGSLALSTLAAAPYVREAERWLPDDTAGEVAPPELLPADAGAAASVPAGDEHVRPARIVLADDNADMRDYLRRLLSGRYRVEAVSDGVQALAAIRRELPDLVLSDVMMPQLDGFGLLRVLRNDPRTASLPVILLSARAGEEATVEGLEAGADDYLVKPFTVREVLSRVAARLDIARVRREADLGAERLRTVLELLPVGVALVDAQGKVQMANKAVRDIWGEDLPMAQRTADFGLYKAWRPQTGQRIAADAWGLARALRTGEVTLGEELDIEAFDGERKTILASSTPLRDETGAIVGATSVIVDVTERRRLERERMLALQEANTRMDEFLGIASHELRTPLTSTSANVQMAERALRALVDASGGLPEDVGDRLRHTHTLIYRTERQMERLTRLVSDLLDTSRVQAGMLELRPEPCELLHIVREAVREQRAAWPERSIVLDLPAREIPLVGDADRLGQVVTNYLGNALKYAPREEPVMVRVRVRSGTAQVEVTDRGPGLSPEQQEGLFERFYRVPGIDQQNGSGVGLGLGLYICRTIVERHSGAVGVRSKPGHGSTFWFTLPLTAVGREGDVR